MQGIHGNLWDYHKKGDWVAVTTNGMVKANGECVMGRGTALQAARKYPSLPLRLGRSINAFGNHVMHFPDLRLFSFPVKHNWWESADLKLILRSAHELVDVVNKSLAETAAIYMPRPGCGNGQLKWVDVYPTLQGVLNHRFTIVEIKP